jgi:hypothetical protein
MTIRRFHILAAYLQHISLQVNGLVRSNEPVVMFVVRRNLRIKPETYVCVCFVTCLHTAIMANAPPCKFLDT